MKRSLLVSALVVLLLVTAVPWALAQYEEDRPAKLSVKVGLYRPSGSTLRSEGASTWKTFGLNYNLKSDDIGRPSTYVALERSAVAEGRLDAQLTGMSYVKIWHGKQQLKDPDDEPTVRGFYYGAGVGLYMLKSELDEAFGSPGQDLSGTKLGYSLVGGYNFNGNYFAELRYNRVGSLGEGTDFSGMMTCVGASMQF